MTDRAPTAASPTNPDPEVIRLDPAHSRMLSWLEWSPAAPALLDDRGRTLRPAGPTLTVRFRGTGVRWEYWPVSREEAERVLRPGREFDFSHGRAFADLIRSRKSGRKVTAGEQARPSDGAAPTPPSTRPRRWLA